MALTPTDNRKSTRHAYLRWAVILVASICVLWLCWAVFYIGRFGSAFTQREPVSQLTIVLAAAKMDRDRIDMIPLTPTCWLKRAYVNGVFQETEDDLDKLLAKRGWFHYDQMGSGREYRRGADHLTVACEMYSGRYQLCMVASGHP